MRAHHQYHAVGQARPAAEARPRPSAAVPSSSSPSRRSRERRRDANDDDANETNLNLQTTTTTRRAALVAASLGGLWIGAGGERPAKAAEPPATPNNQSLCSLLGLPSGTSDDTAAGSTAARLLYDGPGPFLALQLPRLEHTCAPCFPASCVGDRCLQSIYVTYPRPLARRADIDAATPLDPLGAPYPLAVISGGFLLGSDSYSSLAARLATWGYVAVRYDRRDGLTDLLDDASCAELLTDLVTWCSRDPLLRRLADPSRTLLFGHSRGCKIGALTALRLQEEEARELAEEEELLRVRRGGGLGVRRRSEADDKCAAVDAAEAALDAGNAAAEAEALLAAAAAPAAPSAAAAATPTTRKRPRVVGMVCLDPVDTTKYAPESPKFPSALALMRQRADAEKVAEQEEEQQQEQQSAAAPRPKKGIADLPWVILGAASGTDCAPAGSNYSAWFDQVPGPAVEVVIPGAGHMAFTDPPAGSGSGSEGGSGSTSLARSVCSVGTADESEVRRASMALAVAFAEGVVRRGQGGVLAALAEQRCARGGGVESGGGEETKKTTTPATPPPLSPSSESDSAEVVLRSTRQAMERTLAHLRANPGDGGSGSGSVGGLRTRWRGFPVSAASSL
jgi:pimeloyl-ACP methyl ester carboxylesterase